MRVVCIMLSAGKGGIEQACASYCEALQSQGHNVFAIIKKNASIISMLKENDIAYKEIFWPNKWNPYTYYIIRKWTMRSDLVFVHGNRAGSLSILVKKSVPIIAVIHSRFFKLLKHFSGLITITQKSYEYYATCKNIPVFYVPNFVHVPAMIERSYFHTPPTIITMGRFSYEKGFDIFIDALGLLRDRGIPFRACIGGYGGIEEDLKSRCKNLNLENYIEFCGWVSDVSSFLYSCDVFCVPSRIETFSIALIEAMAHGCPVVATSCGGPSEIIQNHKNGLLSEIDANSVADSLAYMIANPTHANRMANQGYADTIEKYSFTVVANKLDHIAKYFNHKK